MGQAVWVLRAEVRAEWTSSAHLEGRPQGCEAEQTFPGGLCAEPGDPSELLLGPGAGTPRWTQNCAKVS